MNEQNNYNDQNNQPHVKKKFFSSAFMPANSSVDAVGGVSSAGNSSVLAYNITPQLNANVPVNVSSMVSPVTNPAVIEMLEDVNATVVTEEPEVLDGFDIPVMAPVTSPVTVPEIEELDMPSFTPNNIQAPVMNQGFNNGVTNGVHLDNQAIIPGATLQNSAIFAAANEVTNQNNVPIQQMVDNSNVAPWMANQPLSANNIDQTNIPETPVMSANQREYLEQQAKLGDNTPVPQTVMQTTQVEVRPELLTKEYIGEEYTNLTMSPFNFGALIFGAAYFAYRKLYIMAIINLCASLGILFFVPIKYNFLGIIALHILMALAFNRIYIFNAKIIGKNAKKSNDKKKNPKTEEQLEQVMRIRGKVSIINLLLVVCFYAASVYAISIYVLKDNETAKLISKSIGGTVSTIKKEEFNGSINYDDTVIINDLINIEIPLVFEGTNNNILEYKYVTVVGNENSVCTFKMGALKDFDDGASFTIKLAAYNEESDKVTTATTNGLDWTNYYTEENGETVYYKGTVIKDKGIFLEYRMGKEALENVCDSYYVTIMDSLSIKEG